MTSIVDAELARSIHLTEHERFVQFILVAQELEAHADALATHKPVHWWPCNCPVCAYRKWKQERTG